jgi:hypothetical protein
MRIAWRKLRRIEENTSLRAIPAHDMAKDAVIALYQCMERRICGAVSTTLSLIFSLIFLPFFVTPAQAGVQSNSDKLLNDLDSGLRRNDGERSRIP